MSRQVADWHLASSHLVFLFTFPGRGPPDSFPPTRLALKIWVHDGLPQGAETRKDEKRVVR